MRDPSTWVFWVYASDSERFEQSYKEIASWLNLLGNDDPKVDISRLVTERLESFDRGRWMMIIDNADDNESFQERTSAVTSDYPVLISFKSYLPRTQQGCYLITSRDRRLAYNLVGDMNKIIQSRQIAGKRSNRSS